MPKKVLVACEYSGTVRDAFTKAGHHAVSCDLLPSETGTGQQAGLFGGPLYHYQGSVLDILDDGWDLMVAFPPCTHLCVSGARWFKDKAEEQADALEFVRTLLNADIPQIALETPVGVISTQIRKPSQYGQPWQFGHGETKKTGLWLKNLPLLTPTNVVSGRADRIHKMAPSPDRWRERSRTYQGIADAMAQQWGDHQ